APNKFSQQFSHDGGRRVNTPSNKSRIRRGRRTQFHGIIHRKTAISRHFGKFCTGKPRNSPPPPQSEYNFKRSPFACKAATSRWRKVSEVFGNVVNRRAICGGFASKEENGGTLKLAMNHAEMTS